MHLIQLHSLTFPTIMKTVRDQLWLDAFHYHESVREEMGKEVFERAKRRRSSATVIVDALVIV